MRMPRWMRVLRVRLRARQRDRQGSAPFQQNTVGPLSERAVRTLVPLALYFVLEVVAKAVVLLQFIVVMLRGRPATPLAVGGAMLAEFMYSLWLYGTFADDTPPWPFSPWPRGLPRIDPAARPTVAAGPVVAAPMPPTHHSGY